MNSYDISMLWNLIPSRNIMTFTRTSSKRRHSRRRPAANDEIRYSERYTNV